jgi:cytidylate kinase
VAKGPASVNSKVMPPTEHLVIAIDGPAAAGKSSASREISQRLGFIHVNSGAMYRALTWSALRAGICPDDADGVIGHLEAIDIVCGEDGGRATLNVDGVDPGTGLTSTEVNAAVSAVSKIPTVREVLVAKQREYLSVGDIVMEGRDIGSVVFPETPFKFYIDASAEVRAARREREGIRDDLASRDAADSSRATSPLVAAEDALKIDTSEMDLAEVVEAILSGLTDRGMAVSC